MDLSEIIILFIRENLCLYDKTHLDYKSVVKKKRVYQLISDKIKVTSGVEISAENIEKRWASLRDQFSRAQRNLKQQPSGSGHVPIKKWDLYDSMSFLIPHVAHRRSKSNFSKPSTEQQQSEEISEDDPAQLLLDSDFTAAQSLQQQDLIAAQSLQQQINSPSFLYAEEVSNTSIDFDHDQAHPPMRSFSTAQLAPSTTISCSSSSSTTSSYRSTPKSLAISELDEFAHKRRESNSIIEKGIDNATQLLGKVVDDMASNLKQSDPYLLAVEDGLKHVPTGDRIKCLIEILQIIDKYQKI